MKTLIQWLSLIFSWFVKKSVFNCQKPTGRRLPFGSTLFRNPWKHLPSPSSLQRNSHLQKRLVDYAPRFLRTRYPCTPTPHCSTEEPPLLHLASLRGLEPPARAISFSLPLSLPLFFFFSLSLSPFFSLCLSLSLSLSLSPSPSLFYLFSLALAIQ